MKCIVKNKHYEVVNFEEETPPNVVLTTGLFNRGPFSYESLRGVKVKKKDYFTFDFFFNDLFLKSIKIENLVTISEFLNFLDTCNIEEINKLATEVQENEKTTLQLELEDLQKQKEGLESKIKLYKEVFNKVDQIKTELLKIENDLN